MYLNIDDRRLEHEDPDGAEPPREGIQFFLPYWLLASLASVAAHALLILVVLFLPSLIPVHVLQQAEIEQRAAEERARQAEAKRFVFVQPRAQFEASRPPVIVQPSDRDRQAQSMERAPNPTNPLPYSRGNTREMLDAPEVQPRNPQLQPRAQQAQPAQPSAPDQGQSRGDDGVTGDTSREPGLAWRGQNGPNARTGDSGGRAGTGLGERLGDAMRNVQRYYSAEQAFENPQGGGGEFGSAIQFDTKGVEFGPWIRRFIAQIKRNWFVPYAAMAMHGRVVVTFNVHKDGSITDVTVAGGSGIEAFDNSSFNAVTTSNPTQALPPEYPSDKAFFTVTFFYNETPPR
jgi:TonB family protein